MKPGPGNVKFNKEKDPPDHNGAINSCWLSFSGSAAAVGAVFRVRDWTPQLPCSAESGRSPPHGSESGSGPAAGLCPLPDHLHREKHPEERLLPQLRQGKLHCAPDTQTCTYSSSRGRVVLFAGLLPVVPLSPRPRPHVCGLQRAPEGEGLHSCSAEDVNVLFAPYIFCASIHSLFGLRPLGGDHRRDPLPVHFHGDTLPALSVSFALLGGVLSLLCVSAAHHVKDEPQGTLLSAATVTPLPSYHGRGSTRYRNEASTPRTPRVPAEEGEDDETKRHTKCCTTAGTGLLLCVLGELEYLLLNHQRRILTATVPDKLNRSRSHSMQHLIEKIQLFCCVIYNMQDVELLAKYNFNWWEQRTRLSMDSSVQNLFMMERAVVCKHKLPKESFVSVYPAQKDGVGLSCQREKKKQDKAALRFC